MNGFDFQIDLSTTEISEWYSVPQKDSVKANVCMNWTDAEGTLNGSLNTELLISNFATTTTVDDIIQIADTKVIDAASGQHNVIIDAAFKAIRLNYTNNNITAGSLKGSVLLKGE